MRYRVNEDIVLLCMPKHGVDGPIAPYLHSAVVSRQKRSKWKPCTSSRLARDAYPARAPVDIPAILASAATIFAAI